jgi:hypothetical protein
MLARAILLSLPVFAAFTVWADGSKSLVPEPGSDGLSRTTRHLGRQLSGTFVYSKPGQNTFAEDEAKCAEEIDSVELAKRRRIEQDVWPGVVDFAPMHQDLILRRGLLNRCMTAHGYLVLPVAPGQAPEEAVSEFKLMSQEVVYVFRRGKARRA